MKQILTTILLLSLIYPAVYSQQQQPAAAGARLVDSFGEIPLSDLKARLDNFAIALQNDPSSKGFIVTYAAKHKFPGWPLRRAHNSLNYLVETRGLDAARISLINGGLRDDTAFELWFVPAGVELPVKPYDISLLMSGEKTALPFDRFAVVEHGETYNSEEGRLYPDDAYLYDYLADVMRHDPGLRRCIIAYTSRRGSRIADRRIAARAKMAIAKAHAIDISRLVAIGGGRSEYKTIELWLVPPGAELPKPTPDERPKRRKR